MNRRHFLTATTAALAAGVATTPVTPASASGGSLNWTLPVNSYAGTDDRPAVFFTAHQDDETLTLGPAIENHVNAGRTVIVVLVTDGAASGVRSRTGLSVPAFSAARDREFAAACRALGVSKVFTEGTRDGQLSWTEADAIMDKWIERFPLASFKAQSFMDSHRDHATLGQALYSRALPDTEYPVDARFYLKREDWDKAPALNAWQERGGSDTLAAAEEYKLVDHSKGRYGIGYQSVRASFDALAADPRTFCHKAY